MVNKWLLHQKHWWNFLGKNIKTSALVKISFKTFNIGQGIFSLDVNRILLLKVTLDLLSKDVITQLALVTNKSDRLRNFDLLTRQYTRTPELAECAVEMNLAWKLTGTERLTLYYDSVEELGQLVCVKCLFFLLRAGVTSESSTYLLLFLR